LKSLDMSARGDFGEGCLVVSLDGKALANALAAKLLRRYYSRKAKEPASKGG
jgi:hypothetical protein